MPCTNGAVRLNVHWHILAADGAWVKTPEGLVFLSAPPLHQEDLEAVFADALRRIARQLTRLVPDRDDEPQDRLSQRQPALAALFRNAMLGHQTSGKDARRPQRLMRRDGAWDGFDAFGAQTGRAARDGSARSLRKPLDAGSIQTYTNAAMAQGP